MATWGVMQSRKQSTGMFDAVRVSFDALDAKPVKIGRSIVNGL